MSQLGKQGEWRQADLAEGVYERGYNLSVSLSVCAPLSVSFTTAEMQQCGVTGLGPSAANHTTHPLHYSNSISIRPPNKSPVRASRCDMLLASDLKPRCRKWDIQLLYHGCKTLYGCTLTQTHTHTLKQRRKVHDVNSHKKGTQRHKAIPLHTCPPHSEPSHPFLF